MADRQPPVGASAGARGEAQLEAMAVAFLNPGHPPAVAVPRRALEAEAFGAGRVAIPGGHLVDRVGRREADLDLAVAALAAPFAGRDRHAAQSRPGIEELAVAFRARLPNHALGQGEFEVEARRLDGDLAL